MHGRDDRDETATNSHGRDTDGHPGPGPTPDHGGTRRSDGTSGRPGRDYARTPLVVTWEATRACALACDHCRAEAVPDRHPDELGGREARRLIDDVATFDPSPVFVVSGGDPLERPDLFDLLSYAAERVPTAVTPAPTPALDRTAIERVVDAGVHRLAVSIDRATADAHDTFRGEPGSFEAARRAADHAAANDLPIQVNTTVTADTVADLPAIADLVERLGAVAWEVFFLVPVGRGRTLDGIDPERAESVAAWLFERSRDAPFRLVTVEAPFYRRIARERADDDPGYLGSVRAGNGFVFVSHRGKVYPSGFLPRAAGSVREASLVDVYREAPLMQALRDPDGFDGPCGRCSVRQICGGSRSRAWAVTGDPLASDPLCPFVDRTAEGTPADADP